ncbi:ferredoxin family protein [Thermogutta sp.]|uniref:ATP-binding protein n=1 Tax=Thermogutta sp. TaxID=1962930 RepID=UPI0032206A56
MSASLIIVFSRPRAAQALPGFRKLVEHIGSAISGVPLVIIPHLYDLVPGGPVLQRLSQLASDMILLAPLFPRAAQLVLRANGLNYQLMQGEDDSASRSSLKSHLKTHRLWAYDYREYLSPDVLKQTVMAVVSDFVAQKEGDPPSLADYPQDSICELEEAVQPRWYPVIDEDRCTLCYECLNFCLFGVYDVREDGRVFTAQPDACRPGCPACARVCPSGAIIFPLYPDPAIAGAPIEHQERSLVSEDQLRSSQFSPREEAEKWRARFAGRAAPKPPQPAPGRPADAARGDGSHRKEVPGRESVNPDRETGVPGPPELNDEEIDRWLKEAEGETGDGGAN